MPNRLRRTIPFSAMLCAAAWTALPAQEPSSSTLEETIPPGANYDKAEFRLWFPDGAATLQAVVVLVPGSNGDGRGMVADSVWQAFANRHHVALLGCRFTDKAHELSFIEEYVDVARAQARFCWTPLPR